MSSCSWFFWPKYCIFQKLTPVPPNISFHRGLSVPPLVEAEVPLNLSDFPGDIQESQIIPLEASESKAVAKSAAVQNTPGETGASTKAGLVTGKEIERGYLLRGKQDKRAKEANGYENEVREAQTLSCGDPGFRNASSGTVTQGVETLGTICCWNKSEGRVFSLEPNGLSDVGAKDLICAVDEKIERAKVWLRIDGFEVEAIRALISLFFPELLGLWKVKPYL